MQNLRFNPEEDGKKVVNGQTVKLSMEQRRPFIDKLSQLGDIFINDAFGTSHRPHASISLTTHNIRLAGLLLEKEIESFEKIERPERPYTVILGGAKVKDKIQLIKNLIDKVDYLLIGGAMAFTFMKYKQVSIGDSMFDQSGYDFISQLNEVQWKKIILPTDIVCMDNHQSIRTMRDIENGYKGYDIGEESIRIFRTYIERSWTLVINGPMGLFEDKRFIKGSEDIIKAISEQNIKSIVGGGDTVSLLSQFPQYKKGIYHISTGGGAGIELLEGKTLPGIATLSNISTI